VVCFFWQVSVLERIVSYMEKRRTGRSIYAEEDGADQRGSMQPGSQMCRIIGAGINDAEKRD
jgi:hypothetical protein